MMSLLDIINQTTDESIEAGEKYLKTSVEYAKLKVFQQVTISLSLVGKLFVIGGLLLIGLVFLAVASAIWIGNLLQNPALGYLIIGFVFMLGSLMVFYYRDLINKTIIREISKKFFD